MVRNHLKPGTYYPRLIQGRRLTLEDLIPNITAKTSFSESDVRGIVIALIAEIEAALIAGDMPVIDGLVSFGMSLSGSFEQASQLVNPETMQINLAPRVDSHLRSAVAAGASFEKVIGDVKTPVIQSFYDVTSEQHNHYTPGSIVRLYGKNLKFHRAELDEGVFLSDGSSETRLATYSVVSEHQVDALLPLHLSGPLTVVVRARYTPKGSMREGHFDHDVELVN
jgi:hypothetical protein